MRIFFILISLIAMDAWLTKAMLAQSSAAKGVGPAIQMVPAIKVLPGVSSQPKGGEERSNLPGRSVVPAGAESTLATPATLTTSTNAPAAKPSRSVLLSQAFLKQSFDRRPSVILETLRGFDTGKDSPGDASANAETESEQRDETQMLKDAIGQELRVLSRQVTLGQWEAVRGFFWSMEAESVPAAWRHLVQQLSTRPGFRPGQPVPPNRQRAEDHDLGPDDFFGLIDSMPGDMESNDWTMMGVLLRKMLTQGYDPEPILDTLQRGTRRVGGDDPEGRRSAARLLFHSGLETRMLSFIPSQEQAIQEGDAEALNLRAVAFLAKHGQSPDDQHLQAAWSASQAVLDLEQVDEPERLLALQRALKLTHQLPPEVGQSWLEDLFESSPAAGLDVLGLIGSMTAAQREQREADQRLDALVLQSRASELWLRILGDPNGRARHALSLMALNWLSEAEYSLEKDPSQSASPLMQYDMYGNLYYRPKSSATANRPNEPQPIASGDLLKNLPTQPWLQSVEPSIQSRFMEVLAKLHLKVREEESAFPYIEQLARTHPHLAHELANEFVRIWTENHDPNTDKNRRSTYMYIYGYNRNAEGIPLTRSKQVRNLKELTQWVQRLRALPIKGVDEKLLARAFTTCHSVAEVYRLEDIESVFGSADTLEPETLAGMIQTMRSNLATVWRQPDVQKKNQTQRKDQELQAEVFRGYQVAGEVLRKGLQRYPEHWAMALAHACILFDENTYRYELSKDTQFSQRRASAFEQFEKAAASYAKQLPSMAQEDESSEVYDFWFYASLGATDLAGLRDYHQPDGRQLERIREAIQKLPQPASDRHLARFANSLSTRISALKAELKHRYLKSGLAIAGDHEKALQARKLFDYYQDLVTEIELEARLDGSAQVGHKEPFGLFVDIRHTKEVERESGGFSKYLQNQNNVGYYYNYGRPTVNYRDDFEEAARETLKEHFEVLSVTFHNEKTGSVGDAQPGWRRTPYAYLLLRALGPEVDMLPSLQMDLDFMDTSGYVVLPVASSHLSLQSEENGQPQRPYRDLTLTQTIDERRSDEGVLVLEIKATARGLVPGIEHLVSFQEEAFDRIRMQDEGVLVRQLDGESEDLAALSERQWLLEFKAKPSLPERPDRFVFPKPSIPVKDAIYLTYRDADLETVGPEILLSGGYGGGGSQWPWILAVVGVALMTAWLLYRQPSTPVLDDVTAEINLPDDMTPFQAIAYLRQLKSSQLSEDPSQMELVQEIQQIERDHFGPGRVGGGNLRERVIYWMQRLS
jgi:hypothetical protein